MKEATNELDYLLTEEMKNYVMMTCDIRSLLQSWGVEPQLIGNVWNGNCPEHNLHDCGRQSKPNWFMNVKNGDCVCLYDCVVSNVVYIAKRKYKLDTIAQAILLLTSGQWKNIK